MKLWQKEFGLAYDVPTAITDVLKDISWHNDASPSFIRLDVEEEGTKTRRLWVEHLDPTMRECGCDAARFIVHDTKLRYEGDDVVEALRIMMKD